MEPLPTPRKVLTLLQMYSDENMPREQQKFGRRAGGQFCLIFQFFALVGCLISAVKIVSIDLEKGLLAFMFASGNFNACYNAVQAMRSRYKITGLFEQLSKIYETSKLFEILQIEKTNWKFCELSEKITL